MIYLVQLEPMEERYTRQWEELFPAACKELDFPCTQIKGLCIGDSVESGTVLDAHGTNYYKATQLQEIILKMKAKEITKGDVLFFYDLWYPGLEMIRYIADITGERPMIAGYLHAGTWTLGDFNQKFLRWGRSCEVSWLDIADLIFVGSEYHKKRIAEVFPAYNFFNKTIVTGAPVAVEEILKAKPTDKPDVPSRRKYDVIWPHRWDRAKNPDKLIEVAKMMPGRSFLVTTSRPRLSNEAEAMKLYHQAKEIPNIEFQIGISKAEYYRRLWESKVVLSTSPEESWGYGVSEGICAGCVPCVPMSGSNPEHVRRLVPDKDLVEEMVYPTNFHPNLPDLDARDIKDSLHWALMSIGRLFEDHHLMIESYRTWVSSSHVRMLQNLRGDWSR